MHDEVTFLFTDIEGSTRLWEQEPERMRAALALHDAMARAMVQKHGGQVVKMTGDGVHAAFQDPLDAIRATLEFQQALADAGRTAGLALPVRCGLHAGPNERRDGDFYGSVVNRAARIMGAAHGGQVLLSHTVAERVGGRLADGVVLRDLGAVRLRDLSQAERLYQLVHPALRSEFPALRSLEATPNNLPSALTSFIGRQRELDETRRLLRDHRLVSLVGMGGLGKSRLACQLAASVLERFPDGVWIAELAPITDGRRVAQAVATVLGVKEDPALGVDEALLRFVKGRELLVLLDNCEHLVAEVAELSKRLLSAAASLRMVVTTREPLRIAGETIFNVPPLAVPGPRHAVEAANVDDFDAVRLFVDRACQAAPDFELTAENAPAVAAICHRLDGIPLAVELAAARVRVLSPAQIAQRMVDRFRLLSAGDRTALPRQRTLRATIDWSHDLLPPAERALFRRLAVFAGGWTLEAAEAVCAGDGPGEAVMDLLGRLVEKSLVLTEDGARRYGMLETVRQYALEQLATAGETATIRDHHLGHFLALASRAGPQLAGPDQRQWLACLDAERENILAAHEWAGQGKAQEGLRLLNAIKLYWPNRGLLELGHRLMVEALERPQAQAPNLARSQALFNAGQIRYFTGRYAAARELLEESLAIARALGDAGAIAAVLQPLGMAAIGQGDLARARQWLEEAVQLLRPAPDRRSLACAVNALAMLRRVEGALREAVPLYEEAVELARACASRDVEAVGLLNLAMLSIDAGERARAPAIARAAVQLAGEIAFAPTTQSALEVCAGLAATRGEWERSARFFGAAEALAAETGMRRDAADESFLAPKIERTRGEMGEAAFTAACAEGRAAPAEAALRQARAWLGAPEVTAA